MPKPQTTLKKRAEFLRLRGGSRWATAAFVLETKPRAPPAAAPGTPAKEAQTSGEARFGFTITKAIGNAVTRNLIRRRLKSAIAEVAPVVAKNTHDYVLIARAAASKRPFEDLKKDLEQAFQRVHHPANQKRRAKS